MCIYTWMLSKSMEHLVLKHVLGLAIQYSHVLCLAIQYSHVLSLNLAHNQYLESVLCNDNMFSTMIALTCG